MNIRITFVAAMSVTTLFAGPPPFPDELLYPNIVPPKHQFGTYGTRGATFSDPSAVVFVSTNRLLVADSGNRRICEVTIDGTYIRDWGAPPSIRQYVYPIALAKYGNKVAVCDSGLGIVALYNNGPDQSQVVQLPNGIHLRAPEDVTLSENQIAIADTGNDRVIILNTSGRVDTIIGHTGDADGEFRHPQSVSFDSSGNVFVADSWNNRIQKFGPSGKHLITWGMWGSHSGLFATPRSITVFRDLLYVTDLTNHRLQAFDLEGNFAFQWGRHPSTAHEGNGRVHYPFDVAVSPNGDLYAVVEPVENRIQVFEQPKVEQVKKANDSAWWDKATRFHYGSKVSAGKGILAISEPDTHSVLFFDITRDAPAFIARAGGHGDAMGKLLEPASVLLNGETGEAIVADAGNRRLERFQLIRAKEAELQAFSVPAGFLMDMTRTISSRRLPVAEFPPANGRKYEHKVSKGNVKGIPEVVMPGALARSSDGATYVFDQVNCRILVYDSEFKPINSFGGFGSDPGQFRIVHNMSFSKDGKRLFVVDGYNFRIQIFSKEGVFIKSFGGPGAEDGKFMHVFGVASGIDGFVYVTDEAKHMVSKFTEEGDFVKAWGNWGTGKGEFYKPKGITQDEKGRLYVINFANHRGDVFDSEGNYISAFGLADPGTERADAIAKSLTLPRYAGAISTKELLKPQYLSWLNAPVLQHAKAARPLGAGPQFKLLSSPDIATEALDASGNSNGAGFKVNVVSADALVAGKATKLKVTISAVNGGSIKGSPDMKFTAEMPAHGHGLATLPQVQRSGTDSFAVDGLRFSMGGYWELYFDIGDEVNTERAQVSVFVKD